jgi:thiamine-phosphate pyrophosphorylase
VTAVLEEGRGEWRRHRLANARLYVVTGARHERGDLESFLDAILEAGVDIVQLREKRAEAGDLLRWGAVFREAARGHGALFVLNDRPDVALALQADGVHVGQNDLPSTFVRDLVGPHLLIGLSTHDVEQLRSAPEDADYLCVGPVHETPTKPGRPATGLGLVWEAAKREQRPWFAIGGIDCETLPPVVGAGARRIVVVRAVTEAADPAEAVRGLLAGLGP